MCSYLEDPTKEARIYAAELVNQATFVALGGLTISLIASVILLRDRRRIYAAISLGIVSIAMITGSFAAFKGTKWFAFTLYLTLVSIVKWPTTLRWVNWPLLSGTGIWVIAVFYNAMMQQTHPCAF